MVVQCPEITILARKSDGRYLTAIFFAQNQKNSGNMYKSCDVCACFNRA